jgi:hypothetical protein
VGGRVKKNKTNFFMRKAIEENSAKVASVGESIEDQELQDRLDAVLSQLPEVQAGKGLWQNKFHEFDVFEHTENFVKQLDGLTADRQIRAAGWLHDIGKPIVAEPRLDSKGELLFSKDGHAYHTFPNHETVGGEMAKKMPAELFENLGLDQEKVASLVACHFLPMKGIKDMRKTANFSEFITAFERLNEILSSLSVSKEEILDMFVADCLSKGKGCTDQPELLPIREALLKTPASEADLRRVYDLQKEMYGNKE